MLSYLNNIVFKKNSSLSLEHNIDYNVDNVNLYQSIFNECKKHLLNKEIKFDNVSTKQKKKDDENIISTNFLVNNLLNILNEKYIKKYFYIQNNTEMKKQKKKLDENIKLKIYTNLKNKNKTTIEKNEKKYKIFNSNETLKYLKNIKNKYFLLHDYSTIDLSKKSCNKRIFNKIDNSNIIKNKKNSIKDNNNFIFLKNYKNNISSIFSSKNIEKNQQSNYEINSFKKIDTNNFFKLNKKSMIFLNLKENIQWKKAISQQVLLSISNKENKAEIHLKPESLGSIYIKIQIQDHQVKLKFISGHVEVENFLNNCIPFLRDSLTKNGIFLKKVNISSSLYSEKNKNLFVSEYKIKKSNLIEKFYKNLTQTKIIDMYI